jgi:hypothetical protein
LKRPSDLHQCSSEGLRNFHLHRICIGCLRLK